MRKILNALLLAGMSVLPAAAGDFVYEPIHLNDGILLIDKGTGWNWFLATGAKESEGGRSWKLLPLPGYPYHDRTVLEQKLGTGAMPPVVESAPPVTWQAPNIDSTLQNSYVQAVPSVVVSSESGDVKPIEARPDVDQPNSQPMTVETSSEETSSNPHQNGEVLPAPQNVPSLDAFSARSLATTNPSLVLVQASSEVDVDENFVIKISKMDKQSSPDEVLQLTLNYPRDSVKLAGTKSGKSDSKSSRGGALTAKLDNDSPVEFVLRFKKPGTHPLSLNIVDSEGKDSSLELTAEVESDDDDEAEDRDEAKHDDKKDEPVGHSKQDMKRPKPDQKSKLDSHSKSESKKPARPKK